jgi:hypothetical protein
MTVCVTAGVSDRLFVSVHLSASCAGHHHQHTAAQHTANDGRPGEIPLPAHDRTHRSGECVWMDSHMCTHLMAATCGYSTAERGCSLALADMFLTRC